MAAEYEVFDIVTFTVTLLNDNKEEESSSTKGYDSPSHLFIFGSVNGFNCIQPAIARTNQNVLQKHVIWLRLLGVLGEY